MIQEEHDVINEVIHKYVIRRIASGKKRGRKRKFLVPYWYITYKVAIVENLRWSDKKKKWTATSMGTSEVTEEQCLELGQAIFR
jgi:hypothetical protein